MTLKKLHVSLLLTFSILCVFQKVMGQSQQDLLASLETGIIQVVGEGHFKTDPNSAQMKDNTLSGTATFLGVEDARFNAKFNSVRLISFSVKMPPSSKVPEQLIKEIRR